MRLARRFFLFQLCLMALGMLGCGSSLDSGNQFSPGHNLLFLTVAPSPASVQITSNVQLQVIASFSDQTTQDVTTQASWTSSNPLVATVGLNTGLATGQMPGTTNIVASVSGISNSVSLTVTPFPNRLFVANGVDNSVEVFDSTASGNVAPLRRIAGANTGLASPFQVAVSASEIFVVGSTSDSVRVFPIGASGDVAPTRIISGANTGLMQPSGVALSGSEVIVSSSGSNSLLVFPSNGSGNIFPSRVIGGALTLLNAPVGLCVSGSDLLVANVSQPGVLNFPVAGSGNIVPLRNISGALTLFNLPRFVAVNAGELFVCNPGSNLVSVFPLGSTGNLAPTRSLTGPAATRGMATTATELFVSSANNRIDVYPVGASGNPAPTRTITGANTNLNGPAGLTIAPAP